MPVKLLIPVSTDAHVKVTGIHVPINIGLPVKLRVWLLIQMQLIGVGRYCLRVCVGGGGGGGGVGGGGETAGQTFRWLY